MTTNSKPPQVLRYMGNKTKLLDFIVRDVEKNIKPNSTILDLMAGTHSFGYRLKGKYKIISNDIQKYSKVIGKAIIENNTYLKVDPNDIEDILNFFHKNLKELRKRKNDFIRNSYSDSSSSQNIINKFYKKNHRRFPYCLFSYYFAGKFFTLENCMKIDSLRYAIEKLYERDRDIFKKSVLLACLMYALSYVVSNSGHFAEFKTKGTDYEDSRRKNVFYVFLKKALDFQIISNGKENKVFSVDYKNLLTAPIYKKYIKNLSLVYFDPPYSNAQYSRFYHIPETLVRYDYPKCQFKGCYRDDRHMSNFCRKTKALKEFETTIKLISKINRNLKLIVSYVEPKKFNGKNSSIMIKKRDIRNVCKKYFSVVTRTKSREYKHSSLGNIFITKPKELYILCKNPKK